VAAGNAQVNQIGEFSRQEFPFGDPDQVIGPAGLPAGSRWNNDDRDSRIAAQPQPVPEPPKIIDALQSVGHLSLALVFFCLILSILYWILSAFASSEAHEPKTV